MGVQRFDFGSLASILYGLLLWLSMKGRMYRKVEELRIECLTKCQGASSEIVVSRKVSTRKVVIGLL